MIVECKGLLFDMDGVLISSIAGANRCWRRWAARYGVADAEHYTIPHGVRAVEIIRGLRPDLGATQVAEGLRLIEDMEIEDVGDLEVLPGVRDLLRSLPPDRWTIVTSATRRLLVARLRAAGLPSPEALVVADEVAQGKPHPEPYLRGAALLGFAPGDCIVVEDAPAGVRAGIAAGSRVLGVLGTHEAAILREAGATWVSTSLREVAASVLREGLRLDLQAVSAG